MVHADAEMPFARPDARGIQLAFIIVQLTKARGQIGAQGLRARPWRKENRPR